MSPVILITGAGGFLGGQLAGQLDVLGYRVISCARRAPAPTQPAGARCYVTSFPDSSFERILQRESPDWLIHCAGPARVDRSFIDPEGDYFANVVVTQSVLDALAAQSPRTKVIFLSSGAVYGQPQELPITERTPARPISPYGHHKLACEALCHSHHRRTGATVAILRVFSAYGIGLRKQVLWDICEKARSSTVLTLDGTGRERRDFIHVDDLTRIVVFLMARHGPALDVLNVASGRSVSIAEIAHLIVRTLGTDYRVQFSGRSRPGVPPCWEVDVQSLAGLGMRQFVPFEIGLPDFVKWAVATQGGLDADRILAAAG